LFVLLYLVLNQPEIVFFSRIGFVAWFPLLSGHGAPVGVSPRYALLACVAGCHCWQMIYGQQSLSFSSTVGLRRLAVMGCGIRVRVLRKSIWAAAPARRVRYVLVSAAAAVVAQSSVSHA